LDSEYIQWLLNLITGELLKSACKRKLEIIKISEYTSVGPDGITPSKLSGLIIIPEFNKQALRLPVIGYQHATQIMRTYAPSQFNILQPFKCAEVIFGLLYASIYANVVVMCDYQGMGEDDTCIQPFVNKKPLALAAADLLLYTVKKFIPDNHLIWNNKLYLIGYSEGGYSTIATAIELINNKKYSDIFKEIEEIALCAGPYSLSDVMRNLMLRDEEYDDGYFLAMVLRGYLSAYGPTYGNGIFTKEKAVIPKAYKIWEYSDGNHTSDEVNELMKKLGFIVPRNIMTQELIEQMENNEKYWEPGKTYTPAYKAFLDNDCVNCPI